MDVTTAVDDEIVLSAQARKPPTERIPTSD